MLRLDRSRLEGAIFPEQIEIATRFDDLDVQGHVNNVAMAVLFQEARGRFNRKHVASLLDPHSALVVGSLFIDYAAQTYYPEPVIVSLGVLDIGRSSFAFGQVVRQSGRATAFAEVTMVVTMQGRAAPLSERMRSALVHLMIRP